MSIFITGTDTDVGKTVVTAGIAAVLQGLGYSVGVYKPVQSGAIQVGDKIIPPDLNFIKAIDPNVIVKSSYNMLNPTAPALAAYLEGIRINKNDFIRDYRELRKDCDFVLVEGAGGLLVPVYNNFLMRDLALFLDLPIIIVARPDLGTINHTLLTIEAAKNAGLKVLGVIISNYPVGTEDAAIKTAPDFIKELSGVNILGLLPKIQNFSQTAINPDLLIDAVINNIDIQAIFNIQIPKLMRKM